MKQRGAAGQTGHCVNIVLPVSGFNQSPLRSLEPCKSHKKAPKRWRAAFYWSLGVGLIETKGRFISDNSGRYHMGPFGTRWAVNIAYYVLPAAAPKSRKVQMLLKFMALIHAPDIAVMIPAWLQDIAPWRTTRWS
jgi:uncharacterized protein YhhL (DUF1145 family)